MRQLRQGQDRIPVTAAQNSGMILNERGSRIVRSAWQRSELDFHATLWMGVPSATEIAVTSGSAAEAGVRSGRRVLYAQAELAADSKSSLDMNDQSLDYLKN